MAARHDALNRIGDVLLGVRRLLQRPAYRRRFFEAMGTEIPPGTLRVVRAVDLSEPREPSMTDVAAMLAVDVSTASRMVSQAVAAGYLNRRTGSTDLRRAHLELTPAGQALLARASAARRSVLDEITSEWSSEDLRTLAVLLERLVGELDRLEP